MCFNKEISIAFFVLEIIVSLIFFKDHIFSGKLNGGNLVLFSLIFSISFMQLNEFFIHRGYKDSTCTEEGKTASYFIPITLLFQLVMIFISMSIVQLNNIPIFTDDQVIIKYISNGSKNKVLGAEQFLSKFKNVSYFLYFLCSLYYLIFTIVILNEFKTSCSKPACDEGCRLKWDILTQSFEKFPELTWIYSVCYFICIFCLLVYINSAVLLFLFFASLAISFIYTSTQVDKTENAFRADYMGSFWCFFGVILSLFVLF